MKKCRRGEIKWCVPLGSDRFRMEANLPGSSSQPDFFCIQAEKAEQLLETICSPPPLPFAVLPYAKCQRSCWSWRMGGAIGKAWRILPCYWQVLSFSTLPSHTPPTSTGKCCPRRALGWASTIIHTLSLSFIFQPISSRVWLIVETSKSLLGWWKGLLGA